jgi:hypothetical protein
LKKVAKTDTTIFQERLEFTSTPLQPPLLPRVGLLAEAVTSTIVRHIQRCYAAAAKLGGSSRRQTGGLEPLPSHCMPACAAANTAR